jgi:AraC family transcriptional regulator
VTRHLDQSPLCAADRPTDGPAIPRLYLSSVDAGWDGLIAEAFQEPRELESWQTAALTDVSLILFRGGTIRFEERHGLGPWAARALHHGDLILRSGTGISHEVRWQSVSSVPTETLHLRLSSHLLARTATEFVGDHPISLALPERSGFRDPLLEQIGFALWQELEQRSPVGKLYARAAAHLLTTHLVRQYLPAAVATADASPRLTDQQTRRVMEFIQANLSQPLTLEALAHQTGFSPYHFARLFRCTLGESPHQYVVRRRIAHAQHLLAQTSAPLAQIAIASGFADQSHFAQVFRRYLGLTPSAYRRDRASGAHFQ